MTKLTVLILLIAIVSYLDPTFLANLDEILRVALEVLDKVLEVLDKVDYLLKSFESILKLALSIQ